MGNGGGRTTGKADVSARQLTALANCVVRKFLAERRGALNWIKNRRRAQIKTCRWCSAEFDPTRDWQEFCCTEHQQAWNRHDRKLRETQAHESLRANGRSEALKKIVSNLGAGKSTTDVAPTKSDAKRESMREFRRRF